MNKLDNTIIFSYVVILIIFSLFTFGKIYDTYANIELLDIQMDNYDKDQGIITIKITRKINLINNSFTCMADNGIEEIKVNGQNNECLLKLDANYNYKIYLINNQNIKSEVYNLSNMVNNVLSFKFASDMLYLVKDGEETINYYDVVINDDDIDYNFKSNDEHIALVVGNKVKGVSKGETYIYSDKISQTLKIKVTDLITLPYATKDKKEVLPCNIYSEEEAKELDEILEYKINNAGYKTRAGAVAAARFLTLEFKYRVPYYYETGRIRYNNPSCNMSNINTREIDGEGRYYHKGLYLSNSKKELITLSKEGPALWGCKIRNLEDKPEYGFSMGKMVPNGLDCSGFVTWSLKNAGFEPGDVGAGEDPGRDCQCTDLGEFVTLNDELLDSNKIKAGDLINWWGHIAMIIGIDEENDTYYIAESLSYIDGVRAMIYTRKELLNTFKYVVLMDNYYQKSGNYTKMWTK